MWVISYCPTSPIHSSVKKDFGLLEDTREAMGCFYSTNRTEERTLRTDETTQKTFESDDELAWIDEFDDELVWTIPSIGTLELSDSMREIKDVYKNEGCPDLLTFTFRELAAATKNFREDCFLGEGGFGQVFKGILESTNQAVAIKLLNLDGLQGDREFLMEVLMLGALHHPNLVKLIGYCTDGDQRILAYEYMSLGSLDDHLYDLPPDKMPLDWITRMKIAAGAARGLEYLHHKKNPPVIYRDLKCANILLDEDYHPKLSDFGLAKLGPRGDKTHVTTRVMGTYGYCAPEYYMSGKLTMRSDIYSFGVVLLEIITGRKAYDGFKSSNEKSLVDWAIPLFKEGKLKWLADPMLHGRYPAKGLYRALTIAELCVKEKPKLRPDMEQVAEALSFLASEKYNTY